MLVADQPRILQELAAQCLVPRAPRRAPLLDLILGHGLRGQPSVLRVLRADLDVSVADDPALVNRLLGNLQVPVRESNDEHSESPRCRNAC